MMYSQSMIILAVAISAAKIQIISQYYAKISITNWIYSFSFSSFFAALFLICNQQQVFRCKNLTKYYSGGRPHG